MKRLPKNKRTQLAGVAGLTVLAIAGLWVGIIVPQQNTIKALSEKKADALSKCEQVKATIARAQQVEGELGARSRILEQCETGMAVGDLYSWAINTLRTFKNDYKVEIPQFSQIDGPKPSNLFPNFPYKQASITIGGTANFYEFGKFIAGFENEYPYIRLANLIVEPAAGNSAAEPERLAFRMDVIALVKPNNS